MNKPLRWTLASLGLLIAGAAAGIGADRAWIARYGATASQEKPPSAKPAPTDEDEEPEPAAVVRTVIAVQGELGRTVEGLGVAAVPPTATFVESWPTDVVVTQVLVQPGEVVAKDAPLAQIAVTRDMEMQVAAARLALESSTAVVDIAQQRLDRGLGTRAELLAAHASHDEAKQRLDRVQSGLPPQDGILHAHSSGIVGAVRVQAGSTVPAATPMMDITADMVVAQIGLDPADAPDVAVGQVFDVRALDDRVASRWKGTVSLLAPAVNQTTRLVDATLTLTGERLPRAGTPLRARASLAGVAGVLVPRVALVPDGGGMVVFVVRDGTAVRTPITIAQRGGDKVSLAGGCAAGDHVVVSGQSQLTAGAVVRELTAEPKAAGPDGGAGADH